MGDGDEPLNGEGGKAPSASGAGSSPDDEKLAPSKIRFIREDDAGTPGNDTPISDEFRHMDVAEALAEALRLDPDLRVIGLVGKWGSGKSKVIRLARKQCEAAGLHFFTYDAWLHQSDAPRRALLEELMADAESRKLDLKNVRAEWDILLGRKERVQIESVPSVPIWVGFVTAMLLAAVLASNFLPKDQNALKEVMTTWSWSNPTHVVAGGAVLFAALPFAVTLGVSVWRWARNRLKRKSEADAPEAADDQLAAVLASRVRETRTDIKTREPDPTVREFQRFVRAILSATPAKPQALATQPRLVVVVDNLDRLPDDQLPALWSTIRGLFHGPAARGGPTLPTVILPIDEGVLLRLYENNPDLATGFSDKTFDIVFRVPTPVNSEWRSYLAARLHEAFGEEWKALGKDLRALVKLSERVLEDAPANTRTPRALNAYTNQLATLWLQRRRAPVGDAALCFYAAHARQMTDPVELLGSTDPWYSETYPNWAAEVAAIHFGTVADTALQVMLHGPLQTALIQRQEAEFLRLSRVPGFSNVLRRLYDGYAKTQPGHLNRAALYLDRLFPTDDGDLVNAWRGIGQGMLVQWTPADEDAVEALGVALTRQTDDGCKRLIEAFPSKVLGISRETFASVAPRILDALTLVDAAAGRLGVEPAQIQLPGGIEADLALCAAITPGDPRIRRFVSQFAPADLAGAVALLAIQDGAVRARWDQYLAAFQTWTGALDWQALVRGLEAKLGAESGESHIHAAEALAGLWAVPEARDSIKALTSGKFFEAALETSLPSDTRSPAPMMANDALAMAFALSIASQGYLPGGAPLIEALKDARTAGPGDLAVLTQNWLGRIAPDLTVSDILDRVEARPAAGALLGGVLLAMPRAWHEAAPLADIVSRSRLFDHFEAQDAERIWLQLDNRLWPALAAEPDLERALYACLRTLEYAEGTQSLVGPALAELRRRLGDPGAAQALAAGILENAVAHAALNTLRRLDPDVALDGPLFDVLTALSPRLLSTPDADIQIRWFLAAQRLAPDKRGTLFESFATALLGKGVVGPPALLVAGGDELLAAAPFAAQPDRFVSRILIPAMSTADCEWFAERHSTISPWLAQLNPDTARALRRALERKRPSHPQGEVFKTHLVALLKATPDPDKPTRGTQPDV